MLLTTTEYDFCDSKQELDYILNTVNTINHNTAGIITQTADNTRDLKQINERLMLLERELIEKKDIYFKKDLFIFVFFATVLITLF